MKRTLALLSALLAAIVLPALVIARPVTPPRPAPASENAQILERTARLPAARGVIFWERLARLAHVKMQRAKLEPAPIAVDEKRLAPRDRQVLRHLVEASRQVNEIYLDQMYAKNFAIRRQLQASRDPVDRETLAWFRICFGPFDRLDAYRNFLGSAPHPPGANFYPEDMTRDEFEAWLKAHPADRAAFTSPYTVIRRRGAALVAVPYSVEYRRWLLPAAAGLRKAATLTDNASFRRFLELRAAALLSNDYFDSEMAWLDVKGSPFELVFGPYEVYQDQLFNYKASFETFVTLVDPEAAAALSKYAARLRDLEASLPIPEEHKNFKRKFESPIEVVQEVYNAGDARAGIQTSAFNLPNDERVREAKGSKKVMLKNVMQAKFARSTTRIAARVVDPAQLPLLSFDAYFRNVLFHELSHGLGPGTIEKDGQRIDSALAMKELHSSLEELKADVVGIHAQFVLMRQGHMPATWRKPMCVSYLAGLFRSARFGAEEAHGRGTLVQYNWLLERGALKRDARTSRYSIDFETFEPALEALVARVLMLQATGDYAGAKALLERYGRLPADLRETLAGLKDICVDIEPVFAVQ